MSDPVPFTGPLVSTETTTDLLTSGTSNEMSGLHYGLPMELCASAITSSWQHRTCTVTSDLMTESESACADQFGSLIKRAHENTPLRLGDTQDRFLCRVLLGEQWQRWHSGPLLHEDGNLGIIGKIYLEIRSCRDDTSTCYASLTSSQHPYAPPLRLAAPRLA